MVDPWISNHPQPDNATWTPGQTARFSVTAAGTPPLSYQWWKDDTALSDGGNLSGVRTPTLTLNYLQAGDDGAYTVTVSNEFGVVTSRSATLWVDATRLAEALDAPSLGWVTGGNAPWNGLSTVRRDGVDAAQSGPIGDEAESWLETRVTGPGTLTFWWRVSSEAGYDFLEFYLDGVLQSGRISGATAWQGRTNSIPVGSHRLRWRYVKDEGTIGGQDRGWLDMVEYVPANPAPTILVNDGGFGFRTNRFGFNVQALARQAVVIEASTNLAHWIPIHTNLADAVGVFLFQDAASGAIPKRFYRARLHVGVLPPPVIITAGADFGLQTNRFGFNLSGVAGQTVVIEASTNLANWFSLATNTLGAGPRYFSDPEPATFQQRFYRARLE